MNYFELNKIFDINPILLFFYFKCVKGSVVTPFTGLNKRGRPSSKSRVGFRPISLPSASYQDGSSSIILGTPPVESCPTSEEGEREETVDEISNVSLDEMASLPSQSEQSDNSVIELYGGSSQNKDNSIIDVVQQLPEKEDKEETNSDLSKFSFLLHFLWS